MHLAARLLDSGHVGERGWTGEGGSEPTFCHLVLLTCMYMYVYGPPICPYALPMHVLCVDSAARAD